MVKEIKPTRSRLQRVKGRGRNDCVHTFHTTEFVSRPILFANLLTDVQYISRFAVRFDPSIDHRRRHHLHLFGC